MKKVILLSVLTLFVLAGCAATSPAVVNQVQQVDLTPVNDFLKDLDKNTEYDFSDQKRVSFVWNLQTEDGEIQNLEMDGKSMNVRDLDSDDYDEIIIENYFTDNGFTVDQNNIADGTLAGQVGYQKDNMVCTVLTGVYGEMDVFDKTQVEITCGILPE